MKTSDCMWMAVAVVLFISTFSLQVFLLLLTSLLFSTIGCFTALYLFEPIVRRDYEIFRSSHSLQMIESNKEWQHFLDNLNENPVVETLPKANIFTSEAIIDDQLNDVLRLAFRDYINSWFAYISPNQEFTRHLYGIAQLAIKSVTERFRSINVVPYITTKLVDDFASHLRLFRLTQTKLKELKVNDANANLLSIFFDFEVQMERNVCRDLVSEDTESCTEYLCQISDILQYLLLPIDCFKNRSFRLLFRGIFVKSCLHPIVEMLSDPDFINQTIVWLNKSSLVSSETFLNVLRSTDKPEELEAVREIVCHEIAVLRSKDSGGDDDFDIKQQLNSLLFVKDLVDSRLKCLSDGNFDSDSTGLPSQIDWSNTKMVSLPFDVVLKNNLGLSYFIEFMSSIGSQGYIYFYLNVEGFKVSAEQLLSEAQLVKLGKSDSKNAVDLESLKEAAINIYETYLSEKASHKLTIDESICKRIHSRILTEKLSENWFDSAHNQVYDIMMNNERYFATFKKSNHYIKLLAELDLLKDLNAKPEEAEPAIKCEDNDNSSIIFDDCDSLNSLDDIGVLSDTISVASDCSVTSNSTSGYSTGNTTATAIDSSELEISAEIIKTGIVREFGNAYAAYVINVSKRSASSEEKWVVLRRYSDFHSFHQNIVEKCPGVKYLTLPGKRTFNNMNRDFVEQRRHLLNTYLNQLLKSCQTRPDLTEHVLNFFKPGNYEKEKFQFSKTVQNSIFNPLKSSVINVGNAVKSGSGNFIDGLQRLSRLSSITSSNSSQNLNLAKNSSKFSSQPELERNGQKSAITPNESSKVSANLDIESEDNIPLRIMLLLMDEVFDLKHKNLWLRRRIVTFLRQIIQATYGDAINKKIIDYVEDMTSAPSIAEYIKAFKNSFWPTGHLAQPLPARSQNTKMRTRVAAKMLLLSSVSDDLKRIIGSETTRRGLMCVFEMFQHENLNRRLVLVLFEGILQELFPDNHFEQIFQKLHSKSTRVPESEKKANNWPPYLYKFLGVDKSCQKSPSKSPIHRRKKPNHS